MITKEAAKSNNNNAQTSANQTVWPPDTKPPLESTLIGSNDEWSRRFLLLVDGLSTIENSTPPHRETGQERLLSACIDGDRPIDQCMGIIAKQIVMWY